MKKSIKKLAGLALVFSTTLALVSPIFASENASESVKTEETAEPAGEMPTEEKPMIVDKENRTIKILASVNGKYLETSTRHGVVYDDGNFGRKSIYGTKVHEMDFHKAMLEIQAKPGNNMTLDNAAETHVEGDIMDITVTWDGADKEYEFGETIIDSNGNPFEFHFGGNEKVATEKHTGCITCLDSCPVGLISNATYTYGAVEKRGEVEFFGNKEILPEDGTPVIITYKIKDAESTESGSESEATKDESAEEASN